MKPVKFTEAEKIVIRALDCIDAECWALLSDHIELMVIEAEGLKKTFTFDDGSVLTIEGTVYSCNNGHKGSIVLH